MALQARRYTDTVITSALMLKSSIGLRLHALQGVIDSIFHTPAFNVVTIVDTMDFIGYHCYQLVPLTNCVL